MLKIQSTIVALALLVGTDCFIAAAGAGDTPPAADSTKLTIALTPLTQLLELMDTDRNGKISKDEFMRFMETEFDYADKNKDGQLDPVELKKLVRRVTHPPAGSPRVRK